MIGVFDSGSGGLTVLNALRQALPDQDFMYYGDHANAPYGHRSNERIYDLTVHATDYLFKQGCSLVILACNTAAAVSSRTMQRDWLPVAYPDGNHNLLGVVVPMVEAVTGVPWSQEHPTEDSHTHHVGLFATKKTVETGSYHREVMKRAPNITLTQHACPGLVDAIEGGAGHRPLQGLINGFVAEMKDMAGGMPDAIVLGCTHFPLVESFFRNALGDQVPIYSQPSIVAESLKDYLSRRPAYRQAGSGNVTLLTTGKAGSRENLARFLPKELTVFGSV